MDGDGTGNSVMGGGEERGSRLGLPQDGRDREDDGQHPHEEPMKWRAGTGHVKITAIVDMWTSSSGVIPGWANTPLINRSTSWTTPRLEFLRTKQSSTTLSRVSDPIKRPTRPIWRRCWYSSKESWTK